MLQSMRNNLKGTVAFIAVGFLSFILVGSLLQFSGVNDYNGSEVASIDGNTITELELLRAVESRRQQLISQFGDQLPPDFLSDERLRPLVLDSLIDYNLLVNQALNSHMTVSDQSLDEYIVALPQFQLDGRYDPELFRNWLTRMRYTAPGFKEVLKDDIIAGQVQRLLVDSGFVIDQEWNAAARLAFQTREFSWITLPLDSVESQITVTEEEIQAFYDENKSAYLSSEKVAVEYIEINTDEIVDAVVIDDDMLRQQYEQEVASYKQQTEREAAHILIEDKEDAEDIIAEVTASLIAGEDFTDLVNRYSDDIGSKSSGGALGFTTGDIFPPKFEKALAGLGVGQVSEPVRTEAGIHFIKLLSLRENQPPSFEQERQRIERSLKSTQAEEIFIEQLDLLKDLSYNAESLAEVAEKLSDEKMAVVANRTELFNRSSAPGILANNAVNNAIFSDQVLKEAYASDVIEIAENHAVVVKMIDYQPVRTLTLEEKRGDIETDLRLKKAKLTLAKNAETLSSLLYEGQDLKTVAASQGLTVLTRTAAKRDDSEIDAELIDFVFSMAKPVAEGRSIGDTHLSNGDYVLISLFNVEDASASSLTEEEQANLRDNLASFYSSDEFTAWQSQLRANADIEIFAESSDNSNSL